MKLTADFYQGDRAMRESGFDPSFRWGPFDGSTHHFAPVCLNSLLYKAEMDLAEMATILGTLQTPRSGGPQPTPASNSSTSICGTPTRECSSTGTS